MLITDIQGREAEKTVTKFSQCGRLEKATPQRSSSPEICSRTVVHFGFVTALYGSSKFHEEVLPVILCFGLKRDLPWQGQDGME